MISQVLLFFFLAIIFARGNEKDYYQRRTQRTSKRKQGKNVRNGSSIQGMNENIVLIVRLFVFFSGFKLFQFMF